MKSAIFVAGPINNASVPGLVSLMFETLFMGLHNTSDWPSLRSILLKLMMNAGCNVAL